MCTFAQIMPDFNQEEFLQHVGRDVVPRVIAAYLKGDMEVRYYSSRYYPGRYDDPSRIAPAAI